MQKCAQRGVRCEMVNADQMEVLRRRLEEERLRLRNDLDAVADWLPEYDGSPTDSRYGNHIADRATDTLEDEKSVALQSHLKGMLAEVERALQRMETGEYGWCENCQEPIDVERLEALPWASSCIRCKSAVRRVA